MSADSLRDELQLRQAMQYVVMSAASHKAALSSLGVRRKAAEATGEEVEVFERTQR